MTRVTIITISKSLLCLYVLNKLDQIYSNYIGAFRLCTTQNDYASHSKHSNAMLAMLPIPSML